MRRQSFNTPKYIDERVNQSKKIDFQDTDV